MEANPAHQELDAPPPASQGPRLLDQVRNEIRLRHYAIRTEQTYTQWMKKLAPMAAALPSPALAIVSPSDADVPIVRPAFPALSATRVA